MHYCIGNMEKSIRLSLSKILMWTSKLEQSMTNWIFNLQCYRNSVEGQITWILKNTQKIRVWPVLFFSIWVEIWLWYFVQFFHHFRQYFTYCNCKELLFTKVIKMYDRYHIYGTFFKWVLKTRTVRCTSNKGLISL